jgi:hypothetical protein
MSDNKGIPPIVAGLLIVPIVLLVKAIDLNQTPSYVPTYEIKSPSEPLYSETYTQPKAELNSENLKAAFPIFPENLLTSRGPEKTSSPKVLVRSKQEREEEYLGQIGCGENGSCYGDLNSSGVSKEVFVNGYYRSDGVYVRSHYRSRPNK